MEKIVLRGRKAAVCEPLKKWHGWTFKYDDDGKLIEKQRRRGIVNCGTGATSGTNGTGRTGREL